MNGVPLHLGGIFMEQYPPKPDDVLVTKLIAGINHSEDNIASMTEEESDPYEELIKKLEEAADGGDFSQVTVDIYNSIESGDIDYCALISDALTIASAFVPEVGILIPFVDLFFPKIFGGGESPVPSIDDIFEALKPKIEAMITKALTEDQEKQLKALSQGVEDMMKLYKDALDRVNGTVGAPDERVDNLTLLQRQIEDINTVLTDRIPEFTKKGYEDISLPYFGVVATIHLMLIKDVIDHGKDWGYKADYICQQKKVLRQLIQKYSKIAYDNFLVGLNSYIHPNTDEYFNYHRGVSLHCLDLVAIWPTLDRIDYPYKTRLEKTRAVFVFKPVDGWFILSDIDYVFCPIWPWDPASKVYKDLLGPFYGGMPLYARGADGGGSTSLTIPPHHKINVLYNDSDDSDAAASFIPTNVYPENTLEDTSEPVIKCIPAEKYASCNGFETWVDWVNGANPMVSIKPGQSITYKIISKHTTPQKYQIRYRVAATQLVTFTLDGFGGSYQSGPFASIWSLSINGFFDDYSLIDGPTVQIDPGIHEFTLTNTTDDTSIDYPFVLDRIEFVPQLTQHLDPINYTIESKLPTYDSSDPKKGIMIWCGKDGVSIDLSVKGADNKIHVNLDMGLIYQELTLTEEQPIHYSAAHFPFWNVTISGLGEVTKGTITGQVRNFTK